MTDKRHIRRTKGGLHSKLHAVVMGGDQANKFALGHLPFDSPSSISVIWPLRNQTAGL